MWRVIGMWLLTIVGAVGTAIEDCAWHVQPLIFYPAILAFLAGVALLRTHYAVRLWPL